MPTEYNLWPLLKRNMPGVHWQRIEGVPGVPDTNGADDGTEFWIEGKMLREGEDIPSFRTGQVAWLVEGWHAGRRCFVLVRRGDELALYKGCDAIELSRGGVAAVRPALRMTKPWDWERLRKRLTGRRGPYVWRTSRPERSASR